MRDDHDLGEASFLPDCDIFGPEPDAQGDVDHDVIAAAPIAPLFTPRQVDVVSERVGNHQWSRRNRAILSQWWVR